LRKLQTDRNQNQQDKACVPVREKCAGAPHDNRDQSKCENMLGFVAERMAKAGP